MKPVRRCFMSDDDLGPVPVMVPKTREKAVDRYRQTRKLQSKIRQGQRRLSELLDSIDYFGDFPDCVEMVHAHAVIRRYER